MNHSVTHLKNKPIANYLYFKFERLEKKKDDESVTGEGSWRTVGQGH